MHYKGREVKELGHDGSDLHGFGEQIRTELLKRIPQDRDISVLDVGTGFAMTTEFLARTLSKGSRIWTLDPSSEVLQHARSSLKAKGLDSRIEFVHGNVDHLDLQNRSFDLVVSVMVLHHVEDLQGALSEMGRVVGSRGSIIVVDYGPNAARELKFRAEHRRQDFFRAKEVASVLERQGFSVESSELDLWYLVDGRRQA